MPQSSATSCHNKQSPTPDTEPGSTNLDKAQDEASDYITRSKNEFWRRWGINGMPSAKIRLAEAAWDAALLAAKEGQCLRHKK